MPSTNILDPTKFVTNVKDICETHKKFYTLLFCFMKSFRLQLLHEYDQRSIFCVGPGVYAGESPGTCVRWGCRSRDCNFHFLPFCCHYSFFLAKRMNSTMCLSFKLHATYLFQLHYNTRVSMFPSIHVSLGVFVPCNHNVSCSSSALSLQHVTFPKPRHHVCITLRLMNPPLSN